jgi:hypothetical protein
VVDRAAKAVHSQARRAVRQRNSRRCGFVKGLGNTYPISPLCPISKWILGGIGYIVARVPTKITERPAGIGLSFLRR